MTDTTIVVESAHALALQETIDRATGCVESALVGPDVQLAIVAQVVDELRRHVRRMPELARLDPELLHGAPYVWMVRLCEQLGQDLDAVEAAARAARSL
jgi:hypothetical protein